MPSVDLSDDDLARAARAARIIARWHERGAERDDGKLTAYFKDQARRFEALASHFEAARQPANRR